MDAIDNAKSTVLDGLDRVAQLAYEEGQEDARSGVLLGFVVVALAAALMGFALGYAL